MVPGGLARSLPNDFGNGVIKIGNGVTKIKILYAFFSTYLVDKVKTSPIGRFLQVVARSACIFLTVLFFFANFFFQKLEFGNGVIKIGNGVTKIWILVTSAPYTRFSESARTLRLKNHTEIDAEAFN